MRFLARLPLVLDARIGSQIGVMIVDAQGYLARIPQFSAYLIAPASGGW